MKSKIAEAIKMKYEPVALIWMETKPEGALEFSEGKWGCVMALVSAAAKGRVSAARKETIGCGGGQIGVGFSDTFDQTPGGIEYFLSDGNPEFCETEIGRKIAEQNPDLLHGEGYIKTPELARRFVEDLPTRIIPAEYVVFKPLSLVADDEKPISVIFMINPDQLSGLVFLANYAREDANNVIIPMGAGCHQIGILAYFEAESEHSRAIVGLTDPSARKITNKALGSEILSFTTPYSMFLEMENEVDNSFLRRQTWAAVMGTGE